MSKTTTLSDVAKVLGVAPSTVQRALSGSPGVSEERRREIQKLAAEMGYQKNALASILKSSEQSVAVILPESGFYSNELWNGIHRFFSENTGFNFHVYKYPYERSPENLAKKLAAVSKEHGSSLNGVITMGEPTPECQSVYRKWAENNVPVIFVGTDADETDRLCCWNTDSKLAGQMGADLVLFASAPDKPVKVLITGDFSISDQYENMQGFEQVLMQRATRCEIMKYSDQSDASTVQNLLRSYIEANRDLTAIYSTSARNTVAMCNAVRECGGTSGIRLIGNDLFTESSELLSEGVLHALIDKRPAKQAYNAAQTLINYLIHNITPPSAALHCNPVIIMNSNR